MNRSLRNPLVLLPCALLLAGCGDDVTKEYYEEPVDDPTNTELLPGEDPPGINITILSVTGGTGPDDNFEAYDRVRVHFTLTKDNGSNWDIDQLDRGRGLVSGPTFNYQRVIAEQSDLTSASVRNGDGSYTYTFADPIPDTYLPPYNDTPAFGADDGELAGMPLLGGTYTVGIYFGWRYTVGTEGYEDIANATQDFLFGDADTLQPRAAVGQENCNACHDTLQAHGGQRREVTLCLLCHTAGSEDRNNPMVAGGTPGVTIEFKVMVHKIHTGAKLPSVLGIATRMDGSRDYDATPMPYELVGFGNRIHDYSEVVFPVWPSLSYPMPRDSGYSMLSPTRQGLDNDQRSGVVACYVCHGDPDGSGPIQAPADGDVAYLQPARRSCGACHDDIDWDYPYTANMQTMPLQADDSACVVCHEASGAPLDVMNGHLHPLLDPNFNAGLVFDLTNVDEAGTNDMDGTFDPGEKVGLTFTITDDMGVEVDPAGISAVNAILSGPTENINLVTNASIPTAALTGMQPYTVNLPVAVDLEFVGDSTAMLDTFNTALTPVWTSTTTTVYARTAAAGGSSTLTTPTPAPTNFVDVVSPVGFDRNDTIVIDDGMPTEEYLEIQWVDGNRLWFASPAQSDYKAGTQYSHAGGATVQEVTLTELTEGMGNDYTLDPLTGTITEESELGAGVAVVVTYTSDFVMPDVYGLSLNGSPQIDEVWGEWQGKSLVSGTYRMGLWSSEVLTLLGNGETNTYRYAADAGLVDVLVGDADTIEPYDLITSINNCYSCHQDMYFHGGNRRGVDSCLQCHGASGSEDRPRYRAANAPATDFVTIAFREMVHKIHQGAELANASTYTVVGFGLGYPNNFSEHQYDEVVFPALADGTKNCLTCHGEGNTAYEVPSLLDHPTEQTVPSRPWRLVCGACHDDAASTGHIQQQTYLGIETCLVCHGPEKELSVANAHQPR